MDRVTFQGSIKAIEEKRLNDLLSFLKSIPLFGSWTKGLLLNIKYDLIKKIYSYNSVLYREGEPSGKVYIVMSGNYQESCRVSINSGLDDEDCLPLLSKKTLKFNMYRANFAKKIPSYCPQFVRNIDVYPIIIIDTIVFFRRNTWYRRLLPRDETEDHNTKGYISSRNST